MRPPLHPQFARQDTSLRHAAFNAVHHDRGNMVQMRHNIGRRTQGTFILQHNLRNAQAGFLRERQQIRTRTNIMRHIRQRVGTAVRGFF